MLAVVAVAFADGTEMLGQPSIAIADGSGIAVGGAGLQQTGSANIVVQVPAGATVKQTLLYWACEYNHRAGQTGDDTIVVNGISRTGTVIGGPTILLDSATVLLNNLTLVTYRADITALNAVTAGTNSVAVSGVSCLYGDPANISGAMGAGITAIYEFPTVSAQISLRDGSDFAYYSFPVNSPLYSTVPQTFTFTPEPVTRSANLSLHVSSVGTNRPNVTRVTVGSTVTQYDNLFTSGSGLQWDTKVLTISVPANVSMVTVQLFSEGPAGSQPASLNWVMGALEIARTPAAGCTATPGYWKTHSMLFPKKRDATWDKLPQAESTPIFGSGLTFLTAMTTPKDGNAYIILAQAYAAAKLNQLAGANTSAIATQLAQAELLLNMYDGSPNPMSAITGAVRDQFISVATALDNYNNGFTGPGHCGG